MDQRIRYCVELEKVRELPDFQRIPAEARFFIVKDYLKKQTQSGKQKGGGRYTAKGFCDANKVPQRTFFNWLKVYRERGIEGLVPKYGSDSCRETSPQKKGKRYVISISLDIVAGKSPVALEEVGKIIAASPLIAPECKAVFSQGFKRLCDLARQKSALKVEPPLTEEEKHRLELYRAGNHKRHSAKATAILMMDAGKSMLDVGLETNSAERTLYRWLSQFNTNRTGFIETKPFSQARINAREIRVTRIIDILHKMPSLYGINRSSWTYGAIAEAYKQEYGFSISETIIQRTIKETGYSWRHARKVLTSPDPEYKKKVERLMDTLKGLADGELFFFIDEVGPYRVRKYGGRRLMPAGETATIPEFQRSKGSVQFVAALKALSNQLTWIFTDNKGSNSLVTLLSRLVGAYSLSTKIYLTWDAIGVHSSKVLKAWIVEHNSADIGPAIEVIPLPANSQFLNVIEAVFGGMKRAVICNSDYRSVKEMQEAIGKHFENRNEYFKANPKRAGNKIWDSEKFDLEKLAGGLFKRM